MTNAIPNPLYQGTAVTTAVTFTVPVPGEPPNTWPPTDPDVVTLTWVDGDGAETTWTYGVAMHIVKTGTGEYYAELDTSSSPGRWQTKWIGAGACAAVSVMGFAVTPTPF